MTPSVVVAAPYRNLTISTIVRMLALLCISPTKPRQMNAIPIIPIPPGRRLLCPSLSTVLPIIRERIICPTEKNEKTTPVYEGGRPFRSNSTGRKGATIEYAAYAMKLHKRIQMRSVGYILFL